MASGIQSVDMRILFISSSSGSRGGGELYLIFLAEALMHQGVEVGLWCSSHSRMDELASSFGRLGKVFRSAYKNTYDYKSRSIQYLFPNTIEGLMKAIDNFKPNVIHVNKQNIEDGLDLLKTLDKLGRPYITTIHITQTEKSLGAFLGGLRDTISKKIIRQSRSLQWITISPSRYRDLITFLGSKDKVVMIPNGVKIEREIEESLKKDLKKKLNVPENNLVVISVGRLDKQKDPLRFIDWAEKCLKTNSNLNFYWIGDGGLRSSFEKKINNYNLGNRIRCLGWQRDVRPFYAMADIYLHTAHFEGLPFSLLEAMSWKLPCVVSEELYEDLSFPKEVIYKGQEGLELVIKNDELRIVTGNCGYNHVVENFSIEAINKSYLSIYKSASDD
jgi:glycosyltransferase involved in cell wall biosynthesis